MWIKRGTTIVNTDNVAAIYLQGDNKLIFRVHGTSCPSTIERGALSAEVCMKGMTAEAIDIIWQAYINKLDFIELD